MPPLSDNFPSKLREEFLSRSVEIGMVLRTWATDTIPPKPKYFVVIGVQGGNATLAVVYVNTDINPNVFNTPAKAAFNIPMKVAECGTIFEHDCFADCSRLYEKSTEVLCNSVENDPSIARGALTADQVRSLRDMAAKSRSISPRQKRLYGLI